MAGYEDLQMMKRSRYVTSEVLADFCEVTVRRIQQLTQDGVINARPSSDGGNGRVYDFLPAVRALLLYYRDRVEKKSIENPSLEDEKLKHEAAKREMAEIKLQMMKGEIHHEKDIEQVFGALFVRLKTNLLTMPLSVAPILTDEPNVNIIAETISERINRALSEIASFDFETFKKGAKDYVDEIMFEDDEENEEQEQEN